MGRLHPARIQAADPDYDFLTYRWTDASGAPVGGTLERTCIEPSLGEQTYTLTVTDGSGASAVARVSVILRGGGTPRVYFKGFRVG